MIQLLFILLMIQIAFILILSFANPLRKLVVKGLDLLKQGRGPLVTKTVAATMCVVLSSTVYTITKIQKRSKDAGIVNPTDEVLMAHRLLEAAFLGNYSKNTFLVCLQSYNTSITILLHTQ